MSMLLMAKVMKMKVGSAARKLVLLKLADNANDKGECFPSYQHIAEQCEMSRKTAIGHIDALCEMGLVKKVHRGGEKGNSSNIYKLNLAGVEITPPSVKITPEVVEKLHHPSVTVTPPPGVNITPITYHSLEPIIEPIDLNTQNASEKFSRYAFEGEVIRVNQKDFSDWQKIYPNLDLHNELLRLDIEYQHEKPKNWFITTSQKLNYQNRQFEKSSHAKPKRTSSFIADYSNVEYGDFELPEWAKGEVC